MTQKVMDYVMNTPCNTNRSVLKGLLSGLSQGGGSMLSFKVGKTTTGEPGTNASVVNSGTSQDIVLDFTIPRGNQGEDGNSPEIGANNNWYIDGVDTGKPAFGADEEARNRLDVVEDKLDLASSSDIDNLFK